MERNFGPSQPNVTRSRRAKPFTDTRHRSYSPAELNGGNDSYLRIATVARPPDEKSDKAEDKKSPTKSDIIELSRVEIEYGGAPNSGTSKQQLPAKSATQLSSSVFVDREHPLGETLLAIDAAAKRGERQVNVVVTILVDLTDDLRIKSFGESAG